MKLAQSVKLGAWFLIALNLVMAFGSIWVFMRMAPAIETIVERNGKSLYACEEMLSTLVFVNPSESDSDQLKRTFEMALERAQSNVTEQEEPTAIEAIRAHYVQAFDGKIDDIRSTVSAISDLAKINREAMVQADWKARQFVTAGAWGIVFMASVVFLIGILFIRGLQATLVKPLEEIHAVIQAIKGGDNMRRCTGPDTPQDIKVIYSGLNDLLDKNTSLNLSSKKWDK